MPFMVINEPKQREDSAVISQIVITDYSVK